MSKFEISKNVFYEDKSIRQFSSCQELSLFNLIELYWQINGIQTF